VQRDNCPTCEGTGFVIDFEAIRRQTPKAWSAKGHLVSCGTGCQETHAPKPYDLTGAIIAFEQGELGEEEVRTLFQHLVDTGMAWRLQGFYGRQAQAMIDAGEIVGTRSRVR
jgi:hypothetical protein